MLNIDQTSSLWAALQDEGAQAAYLLFDNRYAGGDNAVEYLTTKQGTLLVDGNTYHPYRIPIGVEPPQRTGYAVDQGLFALSLAPRSEVEMRVELAKWEGRAYRQTYGSGDDQFTSRNTNLPGVSMTAKVVFEAPETRERLSDVIWFRDSPVTQRRFREGGPTRTELIDATLNLPDAQPPNVKIAPERLPDGIWTTTAGSNTVANEPTYFQFMRFGVNQTDNANERNTMRIALGTAFEFTAENWRNAAGPDKQNRWMTADAEQRYAMRVLNRKTREYRDVSFASMTRGSGGQDINNSSYTALLPDWGDFMRTLPHIQDSSETENLRAYGAQTSIVDITEQAVNVTSPLTLNFGKLHTIAKNKSREGGYRLLLAFSSPFAQLDGAFSVVLTPNDQKARDKTDTCLDVLDQVREVKWSRKG